MTAAAAVCSREQSNNAATVRYKVDPREVRARLDTAWSQILQNKGYPTELIRAALEEQLATTGNDFQSISDFLASVERLSQLAKVTRSSHSQTGNSLSTSQLPHASAPTTHQQSLPDKQDVINLSDNKRKHADTRCCSAQAQSADLERLRKEQQIMQEERRCKVCLDDVISVVLLPCGHACTCVKCTGGVTHCPVCRLFIRGTVKIAF